MSPQTSLEKREPLSLDGESQAQREIIRQCKLRSTLIIALYGQVCAEMREHARVAHPRRLQKASCTQKIHVQWPTPPLASSARDSDVSPLPSRQTTISPAPPHLGYSALPIPMKPEPLPFPEPSQSGH